MVTADHGYSFRVGVDSRRLLSEDNVEEIAPVPLFVKAPGQMDGRVDDSLVRNLDMVATIADLLGTTGAGRQDGRSAFSEEVEGRTGIALSTRDFAGTVRIGLPRARAPAPEPAPLGAAVRDGRGEQPVVRRPWARAYRIGPNRELLDRRVGPARRPRRAGSDRATGSTPRCSGTCRRATRSCRRG